MEKYKDMTGKLEFTATPHEYNISVAYQKWLNKHNDDFLFAFDAFRAGAEHIGQSNNGWISVKNRLPDMEDDCFCCTRDGSVMLVHYETGLFDRFPIVYWMPFPLPPVELQKPMNIICDPCEVAAQLERLVLSMQEKSQSDGDKDK